MKHKEKAAAVFVMMLPVVAIAGIILICGVHTVVAAALKAGH